MTTSRILYALKKVEMEVDVLLSNVNVTVHSVAKTTALTVVVKARKIHFY